MSAKVAENASLSILSNLTIFISMIFQLVLILFVWFTFAQQVINLLQSEGIKWSEENRGTLLVTLDGQTDFSFLDSGSDSD